MFGFWGLFFYSIFVGSVCNNVTVPRDFKYKLSFQLPVISNLVDKKRNSHHCEVLDLLPQLS